MSALAVAVAGLVALAPASHADDWVLVPNTNRVFEYTQHYLNADGESRYNCIQAQYAVIDTAPLGVPRSKVLSSRMRWKSTGPVTTEDYLYNLPSANDWMRDARTFSRFLGPSGDPTKWSPEVTYFSSTEVGLLTMYTLSYDGGSDDPECEGEHRRRGIYTGEVYVRADALNRPPVADFSYSVVNADNLRVQFTDHSFDPDQDDLTYNWSFSGGGSSTERNPRHDFVWGQSELTATLTVTDTLYQSHSVTKTIDLNPPERTLVVNSVGDGAAQDVAADGCDTGGLVGTKPECTLRAAIETANHDGGGTITFALSGAQPIVLATPLPPLTTAIELAGTSQATGNVVIDGGGQPGPILSVNADDVRIEGLSLVRGAQGIEVRTGTGVAIVGNHLGTDPTFAAPGSLAEGVVVHPTAGNDVELRDNVIVADWSVQSLAAGFTAIGNRVGINAAGAAVGDVKLGIVVLGANSRVLDNTIAAGSVGVLAAQAEGALPASGIAITGNRIGLSPSGTHHADQGEAIRIDGALNATVTDNVVAATIAGISVTGRAQVLSEDDGLSFHHHDSDDRVDSALTGGNVTVSGNTIAGLDSPGAAVLRHGIIVWEDAPAVSITGNQVRGAEAAGIAIDGGNDHTVLNNTVAFAAADGVGVAQVGIAVTDAPTTTIGADGAGNRVRATTTGIAIEGDSGAPAIGANTVVAQGSGTLTVGISVPATASQPNVVGNTIEGFSTAVVAAGNGAVIERNAATEGDHGIVASGANARIAANVITETATVAVTIAGTDATVADNLIGTTAAGGTIVGNGGEGLIITAGPATVTGNEVVGSAGRGIVVQPGVAAELRANRIARSGTAPLVVGAGAPAAPTIAGAVQSSYDGSVRTTLLITDLPAAGTGTIEVFANDSCATGEAERVLSVTRTSTAGDTVRLIQLVDRPGTDHFTITYTEDGRTSALSACTSIAAFPDSDGDGSVDLFDELLGAEADPTQGVVVTDNEQLLGVLVAPRDDDTGVGGGRLRAVAAVDTPAGLPAGVTLPYGSVAFEIDGLEVDGSTVVSLVPLDGPSMTANGYWKYGPATPGAAPSWFEFTLDEATMTGAVVGETVEVPGFGLRRGFNLLLRDGQRGDADGFVDGRIVDPGGPAAFEPTDDGDPDDGDDGDGGDGGNGPGPRPVDPTDPSDPADPSDPSTPDGPGPQPVDPSPGDGSGPDAGRPTPGPGDAGTDGSGSSRGPSGGAPGGSAAGGRTAGGLARTGVVLVPLAAAGAVLLLAGSSLQLPGRRRRRPAAPIGRHARRS